MEPAWYTDTSCIRLVGEDTYTYPRGGEGYVSQQPDTGYKRPGPWGGLVAARAPGPSGVHQGLIKSTVYQIQKPQGSLDRHYKNFVISLGAITTRLHCNHLKLEVDYNNTIYVPTGTERTGT